MFDEVVRVEEFVFAGVSDEVVRVEEFVFAGVFVEVVRVEESDWETVMMNETISKHIKLLIIRY